MTVRKVYTQKKVPCRFYLENGADIEHCEKCNFFNGYEKDGDGEVVGVDCLRAEVPLLNCHVTSFTRNGYEYVAREYDEGKDGKLKEEYDYCEKCCFNKVLANGNDVCLLRSGIDGNVENFMCYEGEIWEKRKIEHED